MVYTICRCPLLAVHRGPRGTEKQRVSTVFEHLGDPRFFHRLQNYSGPTVEVCRRHEGKNTRHDSRPSFSKKKKKKITLTTVTNTRPLAPRHSAWDTRCSGPTMTVRLSQSQPCLLVSTLLRVLADLRTFGAAAGHRDDTETRRNILLPIGFRGGGGRGGRGYADVSMQVYAVCVAEAANEKEKQSKRRYVVDEQNKARRITQFNVVKTVRTDEYPSKTAPGVCDDSDDSHGISYLVGQVQAEWRVAMSRRRVSVEVVVPPGLTDCGQQFLLSSGAPANRKRRSTHTEGGGTDTEVYRQEDSRTHKTGERQRGCKVGETGREKTNKY